MIFVYIIQFTFKEIIRDISQEFDLLSSKIAVNTNVLEVLKEDRDKMAVKVRNLEIELEDAQNYSRRNCLLIHGVKEERGEKTDTKVLEIINKQLGVDITVNDIDRSHRIGKPDTNKKPKTRNNKEKTRPIIVKFVSYRERSNVFYNKRKLKGEPISISESLTPTRYKLYQKCMTTFGKGNVWTIDGRIHAIDRDESTAEHVKIIITSEEDLSSKR